MQKIINISFNSDFSIKSLIDTKNFELEHNATVIKANISNFIDYDCYLEFNSLNICSRSAKLTPTDNVISFEIPQNLAHDLLKFQFVFIIGDISTTGQIQKSNVAQIRFEDSINANEYLVSTSNDILHDFENRIENLEYNDTQTNLAIDALNEYAASIDMRVEVLESNPVGQVNADWSITDPLNPAYIKNKPTIPTQYTDAMALNAVSGAGYLNSSSSLDPSKVSQNSNYRFVSDTEKSTWNGKSNFDGNYNSLTNKPTLFSGAYADLSDKPALFDGAYSSLSGKPNIPILTSQLTNDSGYLNSLSGALLTTGATVGATIQAQQFTNGIFGGTGVTDFLTLKGTSGNGTLTSIAIKMLVGNNGATNAITVLNNGNVGIGVTAPGYKLDVSGNTNITGYLAASTNVSSNQFTSSNPSILNISSRGANNIQFQTGYGGTTTNTMIIQGTTGNVGIGTTSPTAVLHLKAGTATAGSSPLKFSVSGAVLLATPEIGATEVDATNIYYTPSTTRNILAQISGSTALTVGSIPFATNNGYLTQDNTNLFWDNSNKRLGINTAVPIAKIQIGTGTPPNIGSPWDFYSFNSSYGRIGIESGNNNAALEFIETGVRTWGINAVSSRFYIYFNSGTYGGPRAKFLNNINGDFALGGYAMDASTDSFTNAKLVCIAGSIGIGISAPNANAILDLTSTTKAFMPPRMDSTAMGNIPSPAAGMLIYNTTTNTLKYYNGSTWV